MVVLTDQSEHAGKWLRPLGVTLEVKYFYCFIVKLITFEIRSYQQLSLTQQHSGVTDSGAMYNIGTILTMVYLILYLNQRDMNH